MTTSPSPTTVALSILDTVTDNLLMSYWNRQLLLHHQGLLIRRPASRCSVCHIDLPQDKSSNPSTLMVVQSARIAAIKLATLTIPTSGIVHLCDNRFVRHSKRQTTPISRRRLFVHKKRTSTKIIAEKIKLPRNIYPLSRVLLIDFEALGSFDYSDERICLPVNSYLCLLHQFLSMPYWPPTRSSIQWSGARKTTDDQTESSQR